MGYVSSIFPYSPLEFIYHFYSNLTANTVSERDESTSGTSVDGITAGIEQAVISDKNQVNIVMNGFVQN